MLCKRRSKKPYLIVHPKFPSNPKISILWTSDRSSFSPSLADQCAYGIITLVGVIGSGLIEGAATHKDNILLEIVDFARSKLLCHSNIHAKYTADMLQAVTAVLDVLLTLDLEPRHKAAHKCEAGLVASNIRTAFSVLTDRAYFCSGYRSEPLLAAAAARQMHEFERL
jgi:hypothetical protein